MEKRKKKRDTFSRDSFSRERKSREWLLRVGSTQFSPSGLYSGFSAYTKVKLGVFTVKDFIVFFILLPKPLDFPVVSSFLRGEYHSSFGGASVYLSSKSSQS